MKIPTDYPPGQSSQPRWHATMHARARLCLAPQSASSSCVVVASQLSMDARARKTMCVPRQSRPMVPSAPPTPRPTLGLPTTPTHQINLNPKGPKRKIIGPRSWCEVRPTTPPPSFISPEEATPRRSRMAIGTAGHTLWCGGEGNVPCHEHEL